PPASTLFPYTTLFRSLKIVPIEQEAVDVLSEDANYFEALEIPADTYGNEEAVPTVAIMNALVVRSDMSEDDVYNLTKYLFENLRSEEHTSELQSRFDL